MQETMRTPKERLATATKQYCIVTSMDSLNLTLAQILIVMKDGEKYWVQKKRQTYFGLSRKGNKKKKNK